MAINDLTPDVVKSTTTVWTVQDIRVLSSTKYFNRLRHGSVVNDNKWDIYSCPFTYKYLCYEWEHIVITSYKIFIVSYYDV